jgi:carotenoid cleavage dioxygenase-like enzyme
MWATLSKASLNNKPFCLFFYLKLVACECYQLTRNLLMAEPLSATNPFLNFPYGPIRMECNARDLIIEGEVPAELTGTLYRNGPNQRFNPRSDYHLFAGDGMVHAFHIENGKIDYVNRWVRTAKWLAEDREGRNVINPMNPFECDPDYSDFVFTDKDGLANTAMLWHGERLMAIEEGL